MSQRTVSSSTRPRITRAAARRYRAGWAAVQALEREELRRMSATEKLQQLAGLMASARPLGWDRALAEEEEVVRTQWMRLRKVLGG